MIFGGVVNFFSFIFAVASAIPCWSEVPRRQPWLIANHWKRPGVLMSRFTGWEIGRWQDTSLVPSLRVRRVGRICEYHIAACILRCSRWLAWQVCRNQRVSSILTMSRPKITHCAVLGLETSAVLPYNSAPEICFVYSRAACCGSMCVFLSRSKSLGVERAPHLLTCCYKSGRKQRVRAWSIQTPPTAVKHLCR